MQYVIFFFLYIISVAKINAQGVHDTTAMGNILEYNYFSDKSFALRWGNKDFMRTRPDTFYSGPPSYGLEFKGENKYAICFEQSCGSPCRNAFILPLNDTSEILIRGFPYSYDMERSLIAYAADDAEYNSDSAIVVENFVTGEKKYFVADNCHSISQFPFMCLDKVEINGDSLYYSWNYLSSDTSKVSSWKKKTVWIGFSK